MNTSLGWQSPRAPTLSDVAALCGVAPSTVSRALTMPDRVNAQTRLRIEHAARELGYRGSSRAESGGRRRTRSIAVFVADLANPFYLDVIRGSQQQCAAGGYAQVLVDTEESSETEQSLLRSLAGSFEGAVLAASRLTDRELTAIAGEIPIVAINRQTDGVPSVFVDTPFGVDQAVEHLVSLGHRRIVYVAGPETSWSNERRWRAFVSALERHGLEPTRVGPFSPKRTDGAAAADAVITSGATACIAFDDLLAIGMLARLGERGVSVPDELSIVGCDDIFGADFCNPPLTTITAPLEQAGRLAVSMLLARAANEPGQVLRQRVVLPTHLTVRGSTAVAPAKKNRASA